MSAIVMYGTMVNGIGANRADTTANGMSTTVTYGETVSGIGANRADTTANGGADGYVWRDGQWYRGEGHHHHDGYWKDGHYYRYDEDRD